MRALHKCYRLGAHAVNALRGVDLNVHAGELLALTGPSGSGKSTLLNLAGLIDRPDAGDVLLSGRDTRGLGETELALLRRESIGFIFQSFNLVPVMSAAENVDYPLFLSGVGARERRQRVMEMLESVGLADHAAHLPDALSGGQRQRVAIARALVKRPLLVIADEPTASLDSQTARQVLDLMRRRGHEQGVAFLFASHDARLVERCDRVLTLSDGEIVPTDSAHYSAPSTARASSEKVLREQFSTEDTP
jgi:putative ABC transport system ATP-binding protein